MAEEAQLYSAIDQATDALERILIDNISNLQRSVDMETEPVKMAIINEKILSSMEKLQNLKERRSAGIKSNDTTVFEKVMKQLGDSPKLVSRVNRHKQMKAIMSQIEDANLNVNENEQND